MIRYLYWIPLEIVAYTIYTWLSYKNNIIGGQWFKIMFIYGIICQPWVIASAVSKNIYFDGILYDFIMLLTFVITMGLLGQGKSFSLINWSGVVLALLAFVLIKL